MLVLIVFRFVFSGSVEVVGFCSTVLSAVCPFRFEDSAGVESGWSSGEVEYKRCMPWDSRVRIRTSFGSITLPKLV